MSKVAVAGIVKPVGPPPSAAVGTESLPDVSNLFKSGTKNGWIETEYDALYWGSQPKVEKEAVRYYTSGGHSYINEHLRMGKEMNDTGDDLVRNIDNSLNRGYLRQDTILYRGDSSPTLRALQSKGNLKPGVIYRDKGYTSTSVDQDSAFGGQFK